MKRRVWRSTLFGLLSLVVLGVVAESAQAVSVCVKTGASYFCPTGSGPTDPEGAVIVAGGGEVGSAWTNGGTVVPVTLGRTGVTMANGYAIVWLNNEVVGCSAWWVDPLNGNWYAEGCTNHFGAGQICAQPNQYGVPQPPTGVMPWGDRWLPWSNGVQAQECVNPEIAPIPGEEPPFVDVGPKVCAVGPGQLYNSGNGYCPLGGGSAQTVADDPDGGALVYGQGGYATVTVYQGSKVPVGVGRTGVLVAGTSACAVVNGSFGPCV